jgi:cytosine/creatinine deaminase
MRAHVEIDAFVELRGVEAMRRLQTELADVLDLELIAFAQEGIFRDGVTQGLLREALALGLPVLGGCPYMDDDQRWHIDWFFETAQAAGVPLDFHADSSDDPARLTADYTSRSRPSPGACRDG